MSTAFFLHHTSPADIGSPTIFKILHQYTIATVFSRKRLSPLAAASAATPVKSILGAG